MFLVEWDKEETDVPAAKDNCRTIGGCGATMPFGVCPPFARAVVPPEVTPLAQEHLTYTRDFKDLTDPVRGTFINTEIM